MPETKLATYTQVQPFFDLTGTTHQTVIETILDGVTAALERHCNRVFMRNAARTDYLTGDGGNVLSLPLLPIESITSVKIASDRDFASVDALTAEDDYRHDPDSGLLWYQPGNWPKYRRGIQVVYVGGYVHPDDSPTGVQVALPYDLTAAAIQQAVYEYNNRSRHGIKGEKVGDASVALLETGELLPSVRDRVARFVRYVI